MDDKIYRLEARIDGIEGRMLTQEEKLVAHQTSIAVIGQRLQSIEKDVHEMKSGITWVIRLLIGALLLALINFGVDGGLAGIVK